MSSNQHQREMARALETQPPIFKLDVDCFEELFEWLSLKDLHAFGRTCKRMQKVAGHFFQMTYLGGSVSCSRNGIWCNFVQINGFSDFIENIIFNDEHMDCFNFVKSNEFKSLKKLCFNQIVLNTEKVECIKKFLGKVEIIEVKRCDSCVEFFYSGFLRYCTNMKRLYVEECDVGRDWLLQYYPSLHQLGLKSFISHPIDELKTFLTRNSSVQHFAAPNKLLYANRHSFMASNVKFDTLSIWHSVAVNNEFRDMLNEFRRREVYKRLNLHVYNSDEHVNNSLDAIHQVPVNTVEKLAYESLTMHVTSSLFVNLKELQSVRIPRNFDVDAVARALVNIEKVHFWEASLNQISAFIRRSRKLSHIGVKFMYVKEDILDLNFWNKERRKLAGARKVTVYVDDRVFSRSKEATQNKKYQLIGIKRFDSHCWTYDYSYFSYFY